jgi:hypothetical protein
MDDGGSSSIKVHEAGGLAVTELLCRVIAMIEYNYT